MIVHYIHRSGVDEANRCLRAWWYAYRHLGTGISRSPSPDYFDIGSAVHEGLACSMRQHTVEQAADSALTYYRRSPNFMKRLPAQSDESQRLIEALIRTWYANGHERFHQMYKVLHVEEEVHVIEHHYPEGNTGRFVQLNWLSRPDAICRERYGPTVAGISWKTIDDANDYRRNYFSYDLQGLMEQFFGSLYVQHPQPSWSPEVLQHFQQPDWTHRVDFIQTIFLQKGKRLKAQEFGGTGVATDDGEFADGQYRKLDNYLINRWVIDPNGDKSPFFNELSASGIMPNTSWMTRYWKPGNKSYNQLSGMLRIPIAQADIAGWIDQLANNQIFPTPEYYNGETALDKVIVWDEPIMRSDMQSEAAVREIRFAEIRRALAVDTMLQVATTQPQNFESKLEEYFPRSWGKACKTPVTCAFTNECYNAPPGAWELPAGYEQRVPHHEPERLYMIQRLKAQGGQL
jgi:hypothetical protein